MKILLIDDEKEILDILKLFIKSRYSHEVLEAQSGNEAIKIMEKEKDNISLALVDWRMKDGNGGVVYNWLKERKFPFPYIMASTDPPEVYEELANLAIDHPKNSSLRKPFKKASIYEVLDRIISAK